MINGRIAFNNCFASITLALTIYLVHGNLRDILPLQRQRLSSSEALPERALPRNVPQAFPQQPKHRYRDDLALTP